MKPIGVFYGSSTGNCEIVAKQIEKKLRNYYVKLHDIAETDPAKIKEFDNLILGASTWGIGELQEDWDNYMNFIEEANLEGKVIALYGLGDQDTYADSFCDGLGVLYNKIEKKNCKLVGEWPTHGYDFYNSKALRNNQFVGLAIDEDSQPELTQRRVNDWLENIIDKFV